MPSGPNRELCIALQQLAPFLPAAEAEGGVEDAVEETVSADS